MTSVEKLCQLGVPPMVGRVRVVRPHGSFFRDEIGEIVASSPFEPRFLVRIVDRREFGRLPAHWFRADSLELVEDPTDDRR